VLHAAVPTRNSGKSHVTHQPENAEVDL